MDGFLLFSKKALSFLASSFLITKHNFFNKTATLEQKATVNLLAPVTLSIILHNPII